MARGLTRSESTMTRRCEPSRDATSMRSLTESVQKTVRPRWSMATPSGLPKSADRSAGQRLPTEAPDPARARDLPDVMTETGSPPSMLALLMEGDVISVQKTIFSTQS